MNLIPKIIAESTRCIGGSAIISSFIALVTAEVSPDLYQNNSRQPSLSMSSSSSSSSANDAVARNRILSSKLYFDVPPSKVIYFHNKLA